MSLNGPASNAATSSQGLVSQESSSITLALTNLSETLQKKNSDYRLGSEFSNFYFAADVAGISPTDVAMSQIGIKIGRIKGLAGKKDEDINYESLLDSYKDLAGYAVLLYGMMLERTG
jgi:hypothetical protein